MANVSANPNSVFVKSRYNVVRHQFLASFYGARCGYNISNARKPREILVITCCNNTENDEGG